MTSTERDERSYPGVGEHSAETERADRGDPRSASESSQPRCCGVPVVTVNRFPTRGSETDDSGSTEDSEDWPVYTMPRAQKTLRCQHHASRRAKLYCWTCKVPICQQCGTTRHLPTSGHDCCDMEDSVDRCRSILQRHAGVMANQYENCLSRIATTNDRIESIRSKLFRFHTATR